MGSLVKKESPLTSKATPTMGRLKRNKLRPEVRSAVISLSLHNRVKAIAVANKVETGKVNTMMAGNLKRSNRKTASSGIPLLMIKSVSVNNASENVMDTVARKRGIKKK